MAREDLLGDPPGGKEGRNDMKIGSMRSKGSPDSERGHFKRTEQCPAPRGTTISIEEMKSLSKGMRSWSTYVGW